MHVLSISKAKTSNGFSILGMPFHIAQSAGCRFSKGQNCYVEVTVGCTSQSSPDPSRNVLQNMDESHINALGTGERKQGSSNLEKTFIYPVETVMVPVIQRAFAKSSPKRYPFYSPILFAVWTISQALKCEYADFGCTVGWELHFLMFGHFGIHLTLPCLSKGQFSHVLFVNCAA